MDRTASGVAAHVSPGLGPVLGFMLSLVFGLTLGTTLFAAPACKADDLGQELLQTVDLDEPATAPFDLDRFKQLVAQGADVNTVDASGESVLLIATIENALLGDGDSEKAEFFEALQILIAKGANVNTADNLGLTPLMMAVHRAHCCITDGHALPAIKPIYDLLLSATSPQPDLEQRNFAGQTALTYLAGWGETGMIQQFLSLGANLYVEANDGGTVFMTAAGAAKPGPFDALLALVPQARRQEVITHRNKSGTSVMMAAVRGGDLPLVQELLGNYVPDLEVENVAGENALSIARHSLGYPRQAVGLKATYSAIAKTLRQSGAEMPALVDDSVQCAGRNSEPWDFNKISAVIKQCSLKSVDELVPLFPASYLSNYILSYAPRGIQKGSFAYPRVIAMGSGGKNIVAFNGDPNLSGYDSVELAMAKPDGHFEFRDITFAQGKPTFSGANPQTCLNCHGQTPRPKWDNWYLWPGMYESEQGAPYPLENARYQEYLANRNTGRYQYLLDPSDAPTDTTLGYFSYSNTTKNIKMDEVMNDLGSNEIAHELTSNPVLQPYKYAILGALSCANRPEDFLPQALARTLPRAYDDLLSETQALDYEEFGLRIKRQQSILAGSPQGNYSLLYLAGVQKTGQSYETARTAKLRYLIEGLGQSMDWSTIFEQDKKRYVITALTQLEAKLWSRWLSSFNPADWGLKNMFESQYEKSPANVNALYGMFRGGDFDPAIPGVDSKPLCAELVKKSLASLSGP